MKKQNIVFGFINRHDSTNADHPARQAAIKIIEQVIEPLLYPYIKRGIKGKPYYILEDKITALIVGK